MSLVLETLGICTRITRKNVSSQWRNEIAPNLPRKILIGCKLIPGSHEQYMDIVAGWIYLQSN